MERIPTWLPVVAVALQHADGRWLMHRRPADKHHGGLWEFPGGKVESEENPKLALVREISEELGIELKERHLRAAAFADGAVSRDGIQLVILLYTCANWTGEPQALEGGAVEWFSPAEIRDLAKPPLDARLCSQLFPEEAG